MGWPSRFREQNLLYAMEIQTDGPVSCKTNSSLNPLGLQVTQPHAVTTQTLPTVETNRLYCTFLPITMNLSLHG